MRQQECNEETCPTWSSWDSWSLCSAQCGIGVRTHTRTCIYGSIGQRGCIGLSIEDEECTRKVWFFCLIVVNTVSTISRCYRAVQHGQNGDHGPCVQKNVVGESEFIPEFALIQMEMISVKVIKMYKKLVTLK